MVDWTSDAVRCVCCFVGLGFVPPLLTQEQGSTPVDIVVGLFFPCYIMPKIGCWNSASEDLKNGDKVGV
jgi:hypothetical protein